MMTEKSNLIVPDFTKQPTKRSIAIKERKFYRECKHLSIEVDEVIRVVTCRGCGVRVDPIQFLIDWSHEDKRIDHRLTAIAQGEVKLRFDRAIQKFRSRFKNAPWLIKLSRVGYYGNGSCDLRIVVKVTSIEEAKRAIASEDFEGFKIEFNWVRHLQVASLSSS
jgi:uncharacterized protein YunC (DUF1805 family)